MQIRVFSIPSWDGEAWTAELNRFLSGHRIEHIERNFVPNGANSFWTYSVTYEATAVVAVAGPPREGTDYRAIMNASDFAGYSKLRALRKQMADHEGVPAYALFTNVQLSEMISSRVATLAAMERINGIGPARLAKYAGPFLAVLQEWLATAPAPGSPSSSLAASQEKQAGDAPQPAAT